MLESKCSTCYAVSRTPAQIKHLKHGCFLPVYEAFPLKPNHLPALSGVGAYATTIYHCNEMEKCIKTELFVSYSNSRYAMLVGLFITAVLFIYPTRMFYLVVAWKSVCVCMFIYVHLWFVGMITAGDVISEHFRH